MILSTLDMLGIMLASTVMLATIGVLLFANSVLIKQERTVRARFKEYRKECHYKHTEIPF